MNILLGLWYLALGHTVCRVFGHDWYELRSLDAYGLRIRIQACGRCGHWEGESCPPESSDTEVTSGDPSMN